MFMSDEIKSLLEDIKLKKKRILSLKLKSQSGDQNLAKEIRSTKKEVARLFTKLNSVK